MINQTAAAAPRHADAELTMTTTHAAKPADRAKRDTKNAALEMAAAELTRKREAWLTSESAEPAEPPKPREPVESVEVKLLDGRLVVFGPPADVSLTMRIATTIPEATTNPLIERLARVCMSVRSIDGQQVRPIGNMVDMRVMANTIGDQGIEILHYWFNEYWGEIKLSELQLIKKNLR